MNEIHSAIISMNCNKIKNLVSYDNINMMEIVEKFNSIMYPLELACHIGASYNVIKLLIDTGANCQLCNNNHLQTILNCYIISRSEMERTYQNILETKNTIVLLCSKCPPLAYMPAKNGFIPIDIAASIEEIGTYPNIISLVDILYSRCLWGEMDNVLNNVRFIGSPIHIASRYNCIKNLKYMLLMGANVNTRMQIDINVMNECIEIGFNNMDTPLHVALDSIDIVKLLLENNANPNLQNINGDTPLHILSKAQYDNNHKENIFYLLCSYGAKQNIVNNNGETCQLYYHITCDDIKEIITTVE
jgi:hypothetical protein